MCAWCVAGGIAVHKYRWSGSGIEHQGTLRSHHRCLPSAPSIWSASVSMVYFIHVCVTLHPSRLVIDWGNVSRGGERGLQLWAVFEINSHIARPLPVVTASHSNVLETSQGVCNQVLAVGVMKAVEDSVEEGVLLPQIPRRLFSPQQQLLLLAPRSRHPLSSWMSTGQTFSSLPFDMLLLYFGVPIEAYNVVSTATA